MMPCVCCDAHGIGRAMRDDRGGRPELPRPPCHGANGALDSSSLGVRGRRSLELVRRSRCAARTQSGLASGARHACPCAGPRFQCHRGMPIAYCGSGFLGDTHGPFRRGSALRGWGVEAAGGSAWVQYPSVGWLPVEQRDSRILPKKARGGVRVSAGVHRLRVRGTPHWSRMRETV